MRRVKTKDSRDMTSGPSSYSGPTKY